MHHGSYCDLDPINLHNIAHSRRAGLPRRRWNLDMENGKCSPKLGANALAVSARRGSGSRGWGDIKPGTRSSSLRRVEIELRAPHAINVATPTHWLISTPRSRKHSLNSAAASWRLFHIVPWRTTADAEVRAPSPSCPLGCRCALV